MAAAARPHILHSSPMLRPSFLLRKLPLSLSLSLFLLSKYYPLQNLHHSSLLLQLRICSRAEAKRQLIAAGFCLLNENEEWNLKPGGCYFFTRNMSCIVAFAVGEKYSIGNGFHVIAAHTDSPCLKLKPKSVSSKSGYLMVSVQTYGGGLWHTWFDRDLSVSGRVLVISSSDTYLHKLVKVKIPLLRIPALAIQS